MTNAVAAESARATSGRRTSLRLGAFVLAVALVLPGLLVVTSSPASAAPPTVAGCGDFSAAVSGWTVREAWYGADCTPANTFQLVWNKPSGSVTNQTLWRQCANGTAGVVLGPYSGDAGTQYSYSSWSCSGSHVVTAEIRHDGTAVLAWTLTVPDPPVCGDSVLVEGEDWGGWGGGGAWGSGEAEDVKAWYWDPMDGVWILWDGDYVELDRQVAEWISLGYYEAVHPDEPAEPLDGWGGWGGGSSWGGSGNWTVACDTDDDDVPDGFIAPPPPDAPMWEPLYPEGAQPISPPPAPDAPAPSGGCDFGITDPSSWLCGLAGLFGNLLDALRWITGWLGRLGSFLLGLFVPDPDVLQGKFADVDAAWDASGPGQLTGGLGDIAAPVLAMDENMPTTCAGPQFTLPLPDSRSFSMHPLSTCGELTQYILGVVYPLETALIYLGGFFLGLRIVTKPFGMDTPGTTQAASA